MKALIRDGIVIQMEATEFPVHSSLVWADCAAKVKVGDLYNNGVFKSPPPPIDNSLKIKNKVQKVTDTLGQISFLADGTVSVPADITNPNYQIILQWVKDGGKIT